MPPSSHSPHDPAGPAERAAMERLLQRLRHDLSHLAIQALDPLPEGQRRRAAGAVKRWLLGLELMWKMEEQVLLPALHEAEPSTAAAVQLVLQEIDILRDLALLSQSISPVRRGPVLVILRRMANLHLTRVEAILPVPPARSVPWGRLRRELRQLLDRWRRELLRSGDIEDEERDPVGQPPR